MLLLLMGDSARSLYVARGIDSLSNYVAFSETYQIGKKDRDCTISRTEDVVGRRKGCCDMFAYE
jgi:hypothetical protein